jgi:diacylglycerol kinase (ATP)
MRYHFYAAILILVLSLILGIQWSEFVVLVILSVVVLSAEMLNTAIEAIIDIMFKEYNPKAKAIKDIAAGAVFITALGAAVIGYIILFTPLKSIFNTGLLLAKHAEEYVAIIALMLVLLLVIITKSFFRRGLPLRGGMPSGHAAVAFSAWVAVTFLSEDFVTSILVFLLAIFIAQSRVYVGIHRPWEVILGALVGSTLTFFLFKVFS